MTAAVEATCTCVGKSGAADSDQVESLPSTRKSRAWRAYPTRAYSQPLNIDLFTLSNVSRLVKFRTSAVSYPIERGTVKLGPPPHLML